MSQESIVTLELGQLSEGLRIAEDLLTESGQVLVPEGTEVSAKMITALANRGVKAVKVNRCQQRAPEQLKQHLDACFAGSSLTPEMARLREILERYHLGER